MIKYNITCNTYVFGDIELIKELSRYVVCIYCIYPVQSTFPLQVHACYVNACEEIELALAWSTFTVA